MPSRWIVLAVALAVTSAALLPVSAAAAFDEDVAFSSRTLTDEQMLRGEDSGGTDVTLSGRLTGGDGKGPFPVVILLHGTDGPRSGAAGTWRNFLNGIGVATFRVDSYTGRGIEQASTDQGSFGQFTQIYDAYRAADALAQRPDIDGSHIVLMGFSRGGTAALYGALSRFHEAFGPRHATIAAYLAFYPACNFELAGEQDVVNAPIREFHGSEDDWTPPAVCRGYFARLRAAGADAVMTEYPGARHAFDNVNTPAYFSDPDAQSSRNCMRREVDFRLINAATGKPFSYADACVEYGPAAQYNDAAATAAHEAVKLFLERLFGGGSDGRP